MENSNKDNKNNEVATTFSEKAKVDISSWNCEICDYRCKNETSLNAHMSRKHPTIQQLDGNSSLGATSIEKIPKISASGRNFLDLLPPLFEKGPYRRKRRYFVPNSNYKVRFFQSFKPLPPISSESRTSPILSIEVAP